MKQWTPKLKEKVQEKGIMASFRYQQDMFLSSSSAQTHNARNDFSKLQESKHIDKAAAHSEVSSSLFRNCNRI